MLTSFTGLKVVEVPVGTHIKDPSGETDGMIVDNENAARSQDTLYVAPRVWELLKEAFRETKH